MDSWEDGLTPQCCALLQACLSHLAQVRESGTNYTTDTSKSHCSGVQSLLQNHYCMHVWAAYQRVIQFLNCGHERLRLDQSLECLLQNAIPIRSFSL